MYWAAVIAGVLIVVWGARQWMALRAEDGHQPDADSAGHEFPFAKYAALKRLTDRNEVEQFRGQRSNARMASLLAKGRRSLVRQYLDELESDFRQLHQAVAVFLAYHSDPPAVAALQLFRKMIVFRWRLQMARLALRKGLPDWSQIQAMLSLARDLQASFSGVR